MKEEIADVINSLEPYVPYRIQRQIPRAVDNAEIAGGALYPYIGGIIRNKGGALIRVGGVADHLHLLVRLRPDIALSDMVRMVKANSSK
ncbi:MAG: transposase [Pedobacter sp.]